MSPEHIRLASCRDAAAATGGLMAGRAAYSALRRTPAAAAARLPHTGCHGGSWALCISTRLGQADWKQIVARWAALSRSLKVVQVDEC